MCPYERHTIVAGPEMMFGPSKEVFVRDQKLPCSINIRESELEDDLKIQVRKDGTDWVDYMPGSLIVGMNIECRMTVRKPEVNVIEVDVYYN